MAASAYLPVMIRFLIQLSECWAVSVRAQITPIEVSNIFIAEVLAGSIFY